MLNLYPVNIYTMSIFFTIFSCFWEKDECEYNGDERIVSFIASTTLSLAHIVALQFYQKCH